MKVYIAALFVLSFLLVGASGVSAQEVSKSALKGKPMLLKPSIKTATLSDKDLSELQTLLKDIDPAAYHVEINQPSKQSVRLGNAAIKDLKTAKVVQAKGGNSLAANEIATEVSTYIKVIWTSSLTGADKMKAAKVDQLLSRR